MNQQGEQTYGMVTNVLDHPEDELLRHVLADYLEETYGGDHNYNLLRQPGYWRYESINRLPYIAIDQLPVQEKFAYVWVVKDNAGSIDRLRVASTTRMGPTCVVCNRHGLDQGVIHVALYARPDTRWKWMCAVCIEETLVVDPDEEPDVEFPPPDNPYTGDREDPPMRHNLRDERGRFMSVEESIRRQVEADAV